ncbi:MAG: radical SAM protein [Elusimicrobiales bacterium]|nr:radical SAM protein [Elusimicrobiales bacterium]
MMPQLEERRLKIVLFAGYSCNNNCRFCVGAEKRALPEKTTAELLREVAAARRKGARILELIGGECTIRPDFLSIVAAAKKMGIEEVVTATNGRMFSAPSFAAAAVRSGLDTVIFSVHGHTAAVHDGLTRSPGSFRQLLRGMANLRRLGFTRINGNTTVVKQNMRFMPGVARLYESRGVRNVEYIFVDPNYGGAMTDFDALVPRISAAAPWMKKALDVGNAAGLGQWKVRYVPLCHFRGYLGQISEMNERALFSTEHWAPDFRNPDATLSRRTVGRGKTGRCRACAVYNICEGIWTEYLRRFGDSELKPMKRAG